MASRGTASSTATSNSDLSFARKPGGECQIRLAGAWRLGRGIAQEAATVERELTEGDKPTRVSFDASQLGAWDSALATVLARVGEVCAERKIEIDYGGLPEGLRRLLELAGSGRRQEAATASPTEPPLVERLGSVAIHVARGSEDTVKFVGEISLALARVAMGRARYRTADVWELIQACGAAAVGIVALISFLVGVILAFMGAVQLERFGASIYVADLVAIGITREMGAMMTAVIMAGRTGAAFAAQLGTMKVRQEVEALETMGISPIEFLVVPRILALVLMMPLLCLYADFIGILGGASIGVGMLHVSFGTYLDESTKAIYPSGVLGGLFKSLVYGILIAVAGCYQGMNCGNSAAAVGEATTDAVVAGIILVVMACGLFSLVFHVIGV